MNVLEKDPVEPAVTAEKDKKEPAAPSVVSEFFFFLNYS